MCVIKLIRYKFRIIFNCYNVKVEIRKIVMYKNILLILGFLLFTACSQIQPEVKEVKPKVEVVIKPPLKPLNLIPVKTERETESERESERESETERESEAIITEFIPEHIKRSHIEVVEHY